MIEVDKLSFQVDNMHPSSFNSWPHSGFWEMKLNGFRVTLSQWNNTLLHFKVKLDVTSDLFCTFVFWAKHNFLRDSDRTLVG